MPLISSAVFNDLLKSSAPCVFKNNRTFHRNSLPTSALANVIHHFKCKNGLFFFLTVLFSLIGVAVGEGKNKIKLIINTNRKCTHGSTKPHVKQTQYHCTQSDSKMDGEQHERSGQHHQSLVPLLYKNGWLMGPSIPVDVEIKETFDQRK